MNWVIVTEENIYGRIFNQLFSDVIKKDNVFICNEYLADFGIKREILNVALKNRIDTFMHGKLDLVLRPQLKVNNYLKRDDRNVVIFLNGALQKVYTENRLKKIKKEFPDTIFVLLFVDASFQKQARNAFELSKTSLFDLIYTFDRNDAINYSFIHMDTPYSKTYDDVLGKGVYFCGSDKGRTKKLMEIAARLSKDHIDYTFDVYGDENLSNDYFKVARTGYVEYADIVKRTLNYNCIIDLVQAGRSEDTGLSLRVYEATVYNKVLITNNKNIFNYRFYNSQYMHYINNSSDIRLEWLNEQADYKYGNELSPKHFFEDIKKRLKL
jgi:hypothetical protein